MPTRTQISCACGQRVISRDVTAKGYLLHPGANIFVFVKFRCSRCKRLGQEIVNRSQWDASVLQENHHEALAEEQARFEWMGPIPLDEALDFHVAMQRVKRMVE